MLRYSVKLPKDTNGTILADVPAIPEAHTFGEDGEEALVRAVDAIETALMGYQVDRLLDLRHASRLDQLEAAFRVLGKRLTLEIREAA
jgi:antitoxin HicB